MIRDEGLREGQTGVCQWLADYGSRSRGVSTIRAPLARFKRYSRYSRGGKKLFLSAHGGKEEGGGREIGVLTMEMEGEMDVSLEWHGERASFLVFWKVRAAGLVRVVWGI